ncbi:IS66 family transposase zinc-finger binding domain-containing protein [Bradyrhizobium sp. WSM471]|uniref:IS66 family transposase zinc-finger binding domain-containing protein n=1 Tax=Bradyrhizobium sp. WSM471 TaxID=319017 RepID=UPI0032566414|nr:IS66 family transposase zinc-finger binding domain-containing protein [Bradyrhizobium canariense]
MNLQPRRQRARRRRALVERRRPVRQAFPDDIVRERVVLPAPTQCPCCGSARLSKLGESVTSTLEEIPRRFKVIDTEREKFSCRDCEAITQSPAPFYATPRGYIGPQLVATILFDKFGQHQPLNRLKPTEPALQMRGDRPVGLDAGGPGCRRSVRGQPYL